MTPHDDLDLQLRGWMRTGAAQAASPHPDLVDHAMARVTTVRQRPRILVRTGEGAATSWVPFTAARWVLLLGALLVMLIAGIVLVGSRPSAVSSPLLVWTERDGFHLVERDRTVRAGGYLGNPLFRDERCPVAIPGTTLVAVVERFAGLRLTDAVGDGGVVATVSLGGYAGTEYFAPEGPRLVQVKLDDPGLVGAAVSVVDLANPPATPSRQVEAPGVIGANVDATGQWLVMAVADGGIRLDRVDLSSGARRDGLYAVAGSIRPGTWLNEVLSVAPGGRHVVLRTDGGGGADRLVIVDLARGFGSPLDLPDAVVPADLAWSPDGRWLAVPQRDSVRILAADGSADTAIDVPRPRDLAWSPDSSRLAFGRGGGGLVTVAPDGSRLASRAVLLAGFLWAPDGTLAAARTSDDGRDMVLEQYRADEVAPIARIGSFAIAGNEGSSSPFAVPRACLSWAATGAGQ